MTVTINGSTGISGVDGSAATPALQGGDTNTGIVFGTDTVGVSTGGVQRTTVDSSGRLLVGVGSATANGGVLELSGGITFPATAVAASNANTLDDYEEGTFTPALKFGGASVSMTGSYVGKYTKIGRMVYYLISITLTNKGTSTGTTTVEGLPFATDGNYATTVAFIYNANSLVGPILPRVQNSGTTLDIFSNGASGYATVSNTNFNNDSQLQIVGTYFT